MREKFIIDIEGDNVEEEILPHFLVLSFPFFHSYVTQQNKKEIDKRLVIHDADRVGWPPWIVQSLPLSTLLFFLSSRVGPRERDFRSYMKSKGPKSYRERNRNTVYVIVSFVCLSTS